ncbi:MAG: hypothetical protein V1774_07535 [Candidatus Eisenbacteria bacterium]
MRRRAHFPWKRWIGALMLLALVMSLASQVQAADKSASRVPSTGENGPPGSHLDGAGGTGGDKGDGPNSTPEGDPDDYGRVIPIFTRLIFLLMFR